MYLTKIVNSELLSFSYRPSNPTAFVQLIAVFWCKIKYICFLREAAFLPPPSELNDSRFIFLFIKQPETDFDNYSSSYNYWTKIALFFLKIL